MKIYICLASWDYEGENVDGVYTSRAKAMKHKWSYCDVGVLQVWDTDKNTCLETVEIAPRNMSRKGY